MIHVAISLPDEVGAALELRARDQGVADLADDLRAPAEAEAEGDAACATTTLRIIRIRHDRMDASRHIR